VTSVAIRDQLKGDDECVGVITVAVFPKCAQIIYTELDRAVDKAENTGATKDAWNSVDEGLLRLLYSELATGLHGIKTRLNIR
jgi:hypothetical protein